MPKYAVAKGKKPGIYNTWDECQKQIHGFCGAKYKKFDTYEQAEDFLNLHKVVLVTSPGKVKTHAPEITHHPVALYGSSFQSVSKAENLMAPRMNAVPKISPSDTKFNSLYQSISSLEEKMGKFVDNMNNKWADIEQRLTAIEKLVFSSTGVLTIKQEGTNKRSASSEVEDVTSHKIVKTTTTELICSSTVPESRTEVNNRFCDNNHQNNKANFISRDDGYVVVYTDGACSNNGKLGAKAGIGVWFNKNHTLNVAEPVRGYATNNNAEIQAATKAIKQAYAAGVRKLDIHTDSQFMIKCITSWINKWKRNNWVLSSGGPVKNKDELIILDNAIKKMDVVRWTHVRGHSGDLGNTMADELARQGAAVYRTNVTYGQLDD